jgi:hypothetical protein
MSRMWRSSKPAQYNTAYLPKNANLLCNTHTHTHSSVCLKNATHARDRPPPQNLKCTILKNSQNIMILRTKICYENGCTINCISVKTRFSAAVLKIKCSLWLPLSPDGGRMLLWNIRQYLPHYTVLLWKPEISPKNLLPRCNIVEVITNFIFFHVLCVCEICTISCSWKFIIPPQPTKSTCGEYVTIHLDDTSLPRWWMFWN